MEPAHKQYYFSRQGIHTHLLLPADSLLQKLPALTRYAGSNAWLRIGWGDRGYYGAPDQNWLKALRALLLPTRSTIEVCPFADLEALRQTDTRLYAMSASSLQFEKLLDFVVCYFHLDQQQSLRWLRAKQDGAQFFASRGIYTALNTCNNWTARALCAAGLKLRASLLFLPGQLERKIQQLGVSELLASRSPD